MATIYLVTSGCYSDYSIEAAFSSRELAEQFIGKLGSRALSDASITERIIDPEVPEPPTDRKPFYVWMFADGTVHEVREQASHDVSDDGHVALIDFKPIGECVFGGFTIGYRNRQEVCIAVQCFARDEKHAVKIVNELRLQIIAANLWPTNDDGYWESTKKVRESLGV